MVGDSGTILHTTNRGETWQGQSSGTTRNLDAVFFVNAATGTAVGDSGTILRTTDAGLSWTSQSSGTFSSLF